MQQYLPFTVLKLPFTRLLTALTDLMVATVLTVYGIETNHYQIYLIVNWTLQQYLPFTVLKLKVLTTSTVLYNVATVLTVYGIETLDLIAVLRALRLGCNSTYRLRY